MSHKRIEIAGDDTALAILDPLPYKVLQFLCNRADRRNICFPSEATIATGTGQSRRNVDRCLQVLQGVDLVRYVRRGVFDRLTGQRQVNAYMVNPRYLLLSDGSRAEAEAIWNRIKGVYGNGSIRHVSHNNQHQEPTPVNQHQLTNTINQHQTTNTDPSNEEKTSTKNLNPEGADHMTMAAQDGYSEPIPSGKQRHAQPDQMTQVSGGSNIYVNPAMVANPLTDAAHEGLAVQLNDLKIALPLARGFVNEYSYTRVKTALAAVEKMGDKVRDPAGLFRSILQRQRIADSVPARKAKKQDQYDEWLQS